MWWKLHYCRLITGQIRHFSANSLTLYVIQYDRVVWQTKCINIMRQMPTQISLHYQYPKPFIPDVFNFCFPEVFEFGIHTVFNQNSGNVHIADFIWKKKFAFISETYSIYCCYYLYYLAYEKENLWDSIFSFNIC